jgi:hypothetical protein
VLAVGQRVFVNCGASRNASVALGDESGKVLSAVHLADGVEVEVIAWRPRGATDTRYRVRRPSDGADGWLACINLRSALVPPPAAVQPETLPSGDVVRPFGQRAHTEQPRPVEATPVAQPSTADEARGRRFGQRF